MFWWRHSNFLFTSASLLYGLVGQCRAVVIEAASVSFADVSSAIASAKDGDTIHVPAGTATWTTTLSVTNNITLQGAGAGSTIIISEAPHLNGEGSKKREKSEAVSTQERVVGAADLPVRKGMPKKSRNPRSASTGERRDPLIFVSLARDRPFRLSGFTFRGGRISSAKNSNGEIRISGNSHSFRVDHCVFDHLNGVSLALGGFLWGVVDHCQFNTRGSHPITVKHATWNGKDWGNGSWADDPDWGSERFVFIEDNEFRNAAGSKTGIDSFEGARFVVRHNRFWNTGLSMHGTEGQGRGAKQAEEYNNIYVNDSHSTAGMIRSGCLITHDNTWTNVAKGHVLQAFRQYHRSPHWGIANGQNPYDDNAPKETVGYWETGKHTGANGATILTDSTKNWTPNQWCQCRGDLYHQEYHTKKPARTTRRRRFSRSSSQTPPTRLLCSSMSFTRNRLRFNTGDTYQIWKINHSLDQPGLGKGDLLAGLPGKPAKWPRQATEPSYSWNNTAKDGEARNLVASEPSIKEGRDFFNGTAKPGYKPYIYPHPLAK